MIPAIKPYLYEVIAKPPKIAQQGLSEQWKHLIFQPLSNLRDVSLQSNTFVVVVDALDECEAGDIRLILRLLAEARTLETVQLRFFITSRPETPIRLEMSEIVHYDLMLHSVPQPTIERDISIFFRYELAKIKKDKSLENDWPGEERIRRLITKADRLFIYAATVCRFLSKSKFPKKRLSEMLEVNLGRHSSTKELDDMYWLILKQSITEDYLEDIEDMARLFKLIVGSIITLFDLLSTIALRKLIAVSSYEMNGTLEPLYSVLDIPQDKNLPVQLFHPSFRDFLLDKNRCSDLHFWIDERQAHRTLADNCIRLMSSSLKQDICGLKAPGVLVTDVASSRVDQCLPLEVRYACLYWIQHLQKSRAQLRDNEQVHQFLQLHLLHWLEALGWIGKTSEGILAILSLEAQISVSLICSYEILTN